VRLTLILRQPILADQLTEGWKLDDGWELSGVGMCAMDPWLLHIRYTFFPRWHLGRWVVVGGRIVLLRWSHEGDMLPRLEPLRRSADACVSVRTRRLLWLILVGRVCRSTVQGLTAKRGSLRMLQEAGCRWTD
jgi:hypothetical protein